MKSESALGEMLDHYYVADAVLDRLIDNAHRIELKGESMRKRMSATE